MGLGDFLKNLFGGSKEKTGTNTEHFTEETIEKVKEMAAPIMAKVEELAEAAKEKISEYVPQATETIDNIIDSAKEKISMFTHNAEETINQKASSFTDGASENADEANAAVKNVTNRVEEDAD